METKRRIKKRRKYDADFKAHLPLEKGSHWSKAGQRHVFIRVSPLSTAPLLEQIESLKKELEKAETERDILKKSSGYFFNLPLREKYSHLQKWSRDFEVETLCQVLGVSRSGYYRFLKGETYNCSPLKEKKQWALRIAFKRHKSRYGSRRLRAELADEGMKMGRHQIRKTMRQMHLKAIQPKSFIPRTTQGGHGKRNSPNLLRQGRGFGLFRRYCFSRRPPVRK